VVAFEIFRRIISPRLDPLTPASVEEFLAKLLADKITWTSLITVVVGASAGIPDVSLGGGTTAIATVLSRVSMSDGSTTRTSATTRTDLSVGSARRCLTILRSKDLSLLFLLRSEECRGAHSVLHRRRHACLSSNGMATPTAVGSAASRPLR